MLIQGPGFLLSCGSANFFLRGQGLWVIPFRLQPLSSPLQQESSRRHVEKNGCGCDPVKLYRNKPQAQFTLPLAEFFVSNWQKGKEKVKRMYTTYTAQIQKPVSDTHHFHSHSPGVSCCTGPAACSESWEIQDVAGQLLPSNIATLWNGYLYFGGTAAFSASLSQCLSEPQLSVCCLL